MDPGPRRPPARQEHRLLPRDYQLITQAARTPTTYLSADRSLAHVGHLQWLWKGWLLRGLPSLLAAVPGTGKSYLALDLARRIIADTGPSAVIHRPDPLTEIGNQAWT